MRYMLMIYDNEQTWLNKTDAQKQAVYEKHMAFGKALREKGAMEGGDELQPTSTATSVRTEKGKVIVTHGPFAETREQLGGYYIIKAENLDEAIAWAKMLPVETGTVEVRPINEMTG